MQENKLMVSAGSISPRPTEQAYAELQYAYDFFNKKLFDSQLPHCLITLQREKDTFGYFSKKRFVNMDGDKVDEIALNPSYFAVVPLVEIMQTLAHEMCHLWQHNFGTAGRSRYHNAQWAHKMEEIGLMPSATGKPGGRKTGDSVTDYAIEGGRFLEACAELITDDFKISWLDRFPSPKQVLSAAACESNNIDISFGGGPAPMHELVSASVRAHENAEPLVQVNQPRRPTRTRYECQCGFKVWGKPSLSISCGVCKKTFVEEE